MITRKNFSQTFTVLLLLSSSVSVASGSSCLSLFAEEPWSPAPVFEQVMNHPQYPVLRANKSYREFQWKLIREVIGPKALENFDSIQSGFEQALRILSENPESVKDGYALLAAVKDAEARAEYIARIISVDKLTEKERASVCERLAFEKFAYFDLLSPDYKKQSDRSGKLMESRERPVEVASENPAFTWRESDPSSGDFANLHPGLLLALPPAPISDLFLPRHRILRIKKIVEKQFLRRTNYYLDIHTTHPTGPVGVAEMSRLVKLDSEVQLETYRSTIHRLSRMAIDAGADLEIADTRSEEKRYAGPEDVVLTLRKNIVLSLEDTLKLDTDPFFEMSLRLRLSRSPETPANREGLADNIVPFSHEWKEILTETEPGSKIKSLEAGVLPNVAGKATAAVEFVMPPLSSMTIEQMIGRGDFGKSVLELLDAVRVAGADLFLVAPEEVNFTILKRLQLPYTHAQFLVRKGRRQMRLNFQQLTTLANFKQAKDNLIALLEAPEQ